MLSVTVLSRESAALSIESSCFLGIPRKRKFLKSAEHYTYTLPRNRDLYRLLNKLCISTQSAHFKILSVQHLCSSVSTINDIHYANEL